MRSNSLRTIFIIVMALLGVLLAVAGISAAMGNRPAVLFGLVLLVIYGLLWLAGSHLKIL